MIPFVKDILALIIAMLRCLVQQLRSVVALLADIELKISTVRASGNVDTLPAWNALARMRKPRWPAP